ncbi:MAG: outer membrane beta-barrel protein [Pseudomonadota bacterium]
MKKCNQLVSAIAAAALTSIPLSTSWADDDSGLYLSVTANRLSADFRDNDDVDFDDSDTAIGARVGIMLTDVIGLEAGYIDLGDYSAPGSTPGNRIELDARALSAAVVLNWSIANQLDLYGKGGLYYVEAESSSTIAGRDFSSDDDEFEPFAAIGIEADFGAINLFGEVSSLQTDLNDLDVVIATVGIKYEFGG